MKILKAQILAGIVAFGACTTAFANPPSLVLVEASVESTADQVSLPSSEQGILTVRACDNCSAQTFYLDKERQLMIGGKTVTLAEMSSALRTAGHVPVTVYYRRTDSAVTRISLLVK